MQHPLRFAAAVGPVVIGTVASAVAVVETETDTLLHGIGMLVLGIGVSALVTWYWTARTERRKMRELNEEWKITMAKRIDEMELKVSPVWASLQSKIIKDLMHPSPQFHEMDVLMHRLESLTITTDERGRLDVLLEERILSTDPEVTPEEKASARLMKGVMAKVLDEAASA